jgi:peptide/nickel transport system permease protein
MTSSTRDSSTQSGFTTIWTRLKQVVTSETFLYIVKRLLQAALTLLLASFLSFAMISLAPGDALDAMRQNPQISPETIEQYRQLYGLDQPWPVQYWRWLVGVVTRFDFGVSIYYSMRPVAPLLFERVYATLLMAIASIIVTWAIAIPLGIVAAVHQNRGFDRFLRVLSYAGQGFPSFITALLLLIFAQYTTPLFPVGGMTSINHADLSPIGKVLDIGWHLILPTIALSITSFAGLQRITRGEMLDVLRQDYIQTARAKGLPENRVIYVHALRNAVNPLITLLGFEFASLLSGAFIAEFFFNWPGLGRLILSSVTNQDTSVVMASLMMGAVMLMAGNLLADLMLKAADPRIRLANLK